MELCGWTRIIHQVQRARLQSAFSLCSLMTSTTMSVRSYDFLPTRRTWRSTMSRSAFPHLTACITVTNSRRQTRIGAKSEQQNLSHFGTYLPVHIILSLLPQTRMARGRIKLPAWTSRSYRRTTRLWGLGWQSSLLDYCWLLACIVCGCTKLRRA